MDTGDTATEQFAATTPTPHDCPPWCVTDHEAEGFDRHDSAGRSFDAFQLTALPDGGESGRAASLLVARHISHGDEWIYVGDGTDQLLELSASSWRRLIAEVAVLLDEMTPTG